MDQPAADRAAAARWPAPGWRPGGWRVGSPGRASLASRPKPSRSWRGRSCSRRHRSIPSTDTALDAVTEARVLTLEGRLAAVENAAQRAAGSAGRADALLVAFAARRAIDRGVALGYLETLLVARFGADHQRAVAQIVTASRDPGPARPTDRRLRAARPGPARRGARGKLVDRTSARDSARWSRSTAAGTPSLEAGRHL